MFSFFYSTHKHLSASLLLALQPEKKVPLANSFSYIVSKMLLVI